jgi:hypothetical protein
MPDNRELASLIFFGVIAGAILAWPATRAAAWPILRLTFWSRLTLLWAGALGWLAGGVALLAWGNIWDRSHLPDTVLWCVFGGILIAFQGIRAGNPNGEFKEVVAGQFKFLLLFELVMNAHPLSLAWELMLLIGFAFLAAMLAVAERDPKHQPLIKIIHVQMALIILGLIAVAVWHFYQNPSELFSREGLEDFCLPIYLTFILLPYGYLVSVYAGYETLFSTRLANHALMPAEVRRYARWQLFKTCGLNANHTRRAQTFLAPEIRWADTEEKVDAEILRLREELAWKKLPPSIEG